MKQKASKAFTQLQGTFIEFTTGQKVVAIVGTAALLLGALFMFKWASKPTYSPLYSNLTTSSASAIVDELQKKGVKYELADGGDTVLVPKDQVYQLRLDMASAGVSTASDSGYAILDKQGLSTSQFKEQTDFKRAMEGELEKTIQALDGVDTAIVHLAMPEKQVFSDQQDPTTASVLVKTKAGMALTKGQVQAITNLVASSIDGLKPSAVTVTDATGKVLSSNGTSGSNAASDNADQVAAFQNEMQARVQSMLDTVMGTGNSSVTVNADLDFDSATTDTTRYYVDPSLPVPPLSETKQSETYNGPAADSAASGVVGPDGQMDPSTSTTDGSSTYNKSSSTSDNAVNSEKEHRVAAPGGIRSLHVGVALDSAAKAKVDPQEIQALVSAAVGIDQSRGDTLVVSSLPFDKTVQQANAAEIAAREKAAKQAELYGTLRNVGIAVGLLLIGLFLWLRSRRKAKQRQEATSYVVEQMRKEAAERAAAQAALQQEAAALSALEAATLEEVNETVEIKHEIQALVERQPEDVAQLLRGWLVER